MINLQQILNSIKNYNYIFCDNILKIKIKTTVSDLFPNLNLIDQETLTILSSYLVEYISNKNFFDNTNKYYKQWESNNARDIKSLILMLIPCINNNLNKDLKNLKDILYNSGNKIPIDILKKNRDQLLKNEFKYSNFVLGLIPDNIDNISEYLLDMEETPKKNEKHLIYDIIHHNFISLIETIDITSNKLYINWINTKPIGMNEYKDSLIYQATNNGLDELRDLTIQYGNFIPWYKDQGDDQENVDYLHQFHQFKKNYNGLYLGDIYNTFRNDFYEDIKKIKWIIFNRENDDGNSGIYMIQYLDKILDLNSVLKYDTYDELDINEKHNLNKNYNKIINNISNKKLNNSNYDFEIDTFKNLVSFFMNNYKYSKQLVKDKKSFALKLFILKDFNDEKKDSDKKTTYLDRIITNDILIQALKDLDIKHIWNYLKETINILKNTAFKNYLLEYDENNKLKFTNFYYFKDTKLNLKNFYNICKSLSHLSYRNVWTILPKLYKSIRYENKNHFFKKLFNIENRGWIQLKRNLDKQSGRELSNSEYGLKLRNIINDFQTIWKDVFWETIIKKGIISKFEVNLDITDETNRPTSNSEKKQYIWTKLKKQIKDDIDNINNSYYYLTNDTYKNLKKIKLKNYNITHIDTHYLDALTDKNANFIWYDFYAMDWISQINFFNHYINHQIIYITGSTGVGKSTQIPKLLLYSLKMYDYKNDGNIICTQPRIPPTEENTERISNELGVPINEYSLTKKSEIQTENYYLQFKHSLNNHINNNSKNLTLNVTTDGTLVEELIQNPLMKEKIPNGKYKDGKSDYIFGINNKYDIIIVDEAHEHNTNMDLILTLTRQVCYYNNAIRLVIISATMDDDEPIYRNYFKLINDNFIYPIKRKIIHPFIQIKADYIEQFQIYSIFLDRRLHISPPGKSTLYKITEKYLNYMNNNEDTYENNEKNSIKKTIEICNSTSNGQILLFSIGNREIKGIVKYLNENIPSNIVAIPYYGNLHPKYKIIIKDIDIKLNDINNKKNKIYEEWGSEYIENNISTNKFTRAIIVATNVAEASITIPNLKFIVDIGYSKVSKYDEKTNIIELETEKISESSRIQRRGRVGRNSSGTVYYMYNKDSRKNIKPKYKITQEDFSNNFLKLSSSDDNEKFLLSDINLYNIIKYYNIFVQEYNRYTTFEILISKYMRNYNINDDKNIWNALKYQYTLINRRNNNYDIISEELFQLPYYKYSTDHFNRYLNGLKTGQLIDENGKIYIIHPKENLFKRNIINQIIEFNDIKVKKIDGINMFNKLLNKLQMNMLYLNKLGDYTNFKKTSELIGIKTKFALKIEELTRNIMLNTEIITTIMIAKGYNVMDEVIQIISMISIRFFSIKKLAKKHQKGYKMFNELYNIYKNDTSDLIAIYNITKNFKNQFNKLLIFSLSDEKSSLIKKLKVKYENMKMIFLKNKSKLDKIRKDIDTDIFIYLKNNDKLDSKSGFYTWLTKNKELINLINNDINDNKLKIINWCNNNFIDYNVFFTYLYNYIDIILKVITNKKNYDDNLKELSSLEWIEKSNTDFHSILKNNSIEEKIITSFIFGYPMNTALKLNLDDKKYHLSIGSKGSISKIRIKNNYKNNSLCSNINSLILYININNEFDEKNVISIITKINMKKLPIILPVYYNAINFKYNNILYSNIENKSKIIKFYGKLYDDIIYNIRNNHTFNHFILNNKEFPQIQSFIKMFKKDLLKKIETI